MFSWPSPVMWARKWEFLECNILVTRVPRQLWVYHHGIEVPFSRFQPLGPFLQSDLSRTPSCQMTAYHCYRLHSTSWAKNAIATTLYPNIVVMELNSELYFSTCFPSSVSSLSHGVSHIVPSFPTCTVGESGYSLLPRDIIRGLLMIFISCVSWHPVYLRCKYKDGKLKRSTRMWPGVPLECGLGSNNVIWQWSLSLCPQLNRITTMRPYSCP